MIEPSEICASSLPIPRQDFLERSLGKFALVELNVGDAGMAPLQKQLFQKILRTDDFDIPFRLFPLQLLDHLYTLTVEHIGKIEKILAERGIGHFRLDQSGYMTILHPHEIGFPSVFGADILEQIFLAGRIGFSE